jgi:hypothetical protein
MLCVVAEEKGILGLRDGETHLRLHLVEEIETSGQTEMTEKKTRGRRDA